MKHEKLKHSWNVQNFKARVECEKLRPSQNMSNKGVLKMCKIETLTDPI
jgi:hypothetical protein